MRKSLPSSYSMSSSLRSNLHDNDDCCDYWHIIFVVGLLLMGILGVTGWELGGEGRKWVERPLLHAWDQAEAPVCREPGGVCTKIFIIMMLFYTSNCLGRAASQQTQRAMICQKIAFSRWRSSPSSPWIMMFLNIHRLLQKVVHSLPLTWHFPLCQIYSKSKCNLVD